MKTSIKDTMLIFFLCGYLTFLPACGDSTGPADTAPDIPPQETMTLDLSLFDGGNQILSKTSDLNNLRTNFGEAVLTVLVVNLWVIVALTIPVGATAAALSVEPTFDEAAGKWCWNTSHEFPKQTISLQLKAQINGDVINWEMFVTRQLPTPLTDFLWYTGENRIDGTSGHWQFYDEIRPEESQQTVRINWIYTSETDRTLAFLNNSDDADAGDSITYTVDGDIVTMTLIDVSASNTVEVSWNKTTQEGYISKNGVKGCWDENLLDTACSTD